ncbi:hypothetical protein OsJ_23873 [Oryza sativa Japonica Group]|uniref:Uncharacterized protein n=1 Tax=Oryza sativa subsp. japonica TaxID=39947 RepID=A3BIQ3_ORYSJ|nr:hypothetical protein OsJ_23873 [Oryza sativa Japonica Group]
MTTPLPYAAAATAATGEDPDQIGRLPDCLLTTILSLLPLDAAARTTALSRRWRSLWPSAPLRLHDSDLPSRSQYLSAAISGILASHRGDAELLLQPPSEPLPLPPSLLGCHSLRSADLTNCRLPAAAAATASFPHLHELTLRYCFASSRALHGLLAGCPALAALSLDRVFGCRSLRVRSRTLRSLTVSVSLRRRDEVGDELQDLAVEDGPLLERLLGHDVNWGPSIHVLHAPRLEMLGYLGVGIPSLQIGAALFHSMRAVRLAAEFRCLKTLALEMVDPQVKPVVDFLRCFPCLEALYITSHMFEPRSMETLKCDNMDYPIECLNRHLKKVVLAGYEGRRRELQLARFLVSNARVLQVMKFLCANDCKPTWLASQKRQLCWESRLSLGPQVIFEVYRKSHTRFRKHASNITLVDPFDVKT